MRILIAPNAFKHSLTASEAAEAVKEGLGQSSLACTCECFPIGDGGDGTGVLITQKLEGTTVMADVQDALGRPVRASYGLTQGGTTAIIEMASASGISLLAAHELNPLHASSFGTGELIKHALDNNIKKLIVSMGGSATVDGGSGILKALGVRFLGADKNELCSLPFDLPDLHEVDTSHIDPRILECEIVVLCDVENVLLGAAGAASVFGPQKGASQLDIVHLERALQRLRDVALEKTGRDMNDVLRGGTAGGAAAGLYAFLNASLVNGIDHFLELTDFQAALRKADLLITGEGSIDEQTLSGKGPFGVARMAQNMGIPVIGLAGRVPLVDSAGLGKFFNVLVAIGNGPSDIETAKVNTTANLIRTGKQLGCLLALKEGS